MERFPKTYLPIIDKLWKLELLHLVSQYRSYAVMSLSGMFIDYFPTFLFLELISILMSHHIFPFVISENY